MSDKDILRNMDAPRRLVFDELHARTGATPSEFNHRHRNRTVEHKLANARRRLQNDPTLSERKRQLLKADIERFSKDGSS